MRCAALSAAGRQAPGDVSTKRGLGSMIGHVDSTDDQAVNQGPDDFGAGHGLADFPANTLGQAVEAGDLPFEEHDGYLGPRLLMNAGASSTWLGGCLRL